MRQKLFTGLALVLHLSFFCTTAWAELYCEHAVYQAGQVRNGLPLTHRFNLVNRGRNTIEITDVRVTCGCLTPQLAKRTLRPGEQSTVLLEINTLALAEGTQSWRTRLIYHDGATTNELELLVVGDVLTEVLVQPSALTLPAEAPGVHEIIVTDRRAHTLTIRATGVCVAYLRAVIGDAQHDGNTSVQKVRLEIPANCPEGRHDIALHLYTDDPNYRELTVPVTVVKRPHGQVSATPGQVTFDGDKGQSLPPRLVRLSAGEGREVEVESAVADDAAIRCTWEKGPGSLATVKILVDPNRLTGDLHTTVRVHLLKPTLETVVIPVLCVVR